MKVTINGEGVTPGAVHAILEDLEKEYGLNIRDLTLYVRFVNKDGKVVEPKLPANGSELIMTVNKTENKKKTGGSEPISLENMKALIEKNIGRLLNPIEIQSLVYLSEEKIDTATFMNALFKVVDSRPNFNMRYFERVVLAALKNND